MKQIKLNDGNMIPQYGMGTWFLKPSNFTNVIKAAYENGIRYFDVAQQYNNEKLLGDALQELNIDPNEVFITTKVYVNNYESKEVFFESIKQSITRLQKDHIDLLLLHWPKQKFDNVLVWKWMLEARQKGYAKSIGVSNFSAELIHELIKKTKVAPATNHLEIQLINQQPENVEYCESKGILVQPYSILRPYFANKAFTYGIQTMTDEEKEIVEKIGNKYEKSAVHVMLRWALQRGFQIFPKVTKIERFEDNNKIFEFELFEEDMEVLNGMSRVDYETIDIFNEGLEPALEAGLEKGPYLYKDFYKVVDGKIAEGSKEEFEQELLDLETSIEEYFGGK